MWDAFDAFLIASGPQQWDQPTIEQLLYVLARDNEFEVLKEKLVHNPGHLVTLARAGRFAAAVVLSRLGGAGWATIPCNLRPANPLGLARLFGRRHTRAAMINTEREALMLLKRTDRRLEAAAWLARSMGYTSREAVLCSLEKPQGRKVGTRIMETAADGNQTWLMLIEKDALEIALALHMERCGAPTFPTAALQDDYVTALEQALRAGLTPVPARTAALRTIDHALSAAGARGQCQWAGS